MSEFAEYENILKREMGGYILGICACLVLTVVVILMYKTHCFDDFTKLQGIFSILLITTAIVAATINLSLGIYNVICDIDEQSTVIYEGDFEIASNNTGYVTLKNDGKSITLSGKCWGHRGGKYKGKIIYAEHSKRLLDWVIIEGPY